MKLVECVPNFSEGRRSDVVEAIRDAIGGVDGVVVLDVSSDHSHNRTVITFVAPADRAVDAAFAGIAAARDRIDLTAHTGEHPRMGAADVVPFVPLEGATMDDCIALARSLGGRVGNELEIPVFLYERAATRPERENLADVRRGQFEGLRDEIGTNPARDPDFGPRRIHPTAGAIAIGARPFLIAYNVYLGPASNLEVARAVARTVRGSSGGLRFVKAMGLEVDGQAQVSMNLVDIDRTPVHVAFDLVKAEALAHGVATTWSEIVGLIPERAIDAAAARHLQLRGFSDRLIVERRVRAAMQGGASLAATLAAIAAPTPTPGGGSVAALAGALAAALAQMVAALTVGKAKYAPVEPQMKDAAVRAAALVQHLSALAERDAQAYAAVSAAYRLPAEPAAARRQAVDEALTGAAEVPLEAADACARVAELALLVAEHGNRNAISDAGVAALMADAACRGAAYNVRINVAALSDGSRGAPLVREAAARVERAAAAAARTTALVETAIGPAHR